ncbi:UNVERIFIED_CONTAM: Ubiquitin-like-specific protease 1A [Sesamum calycinum]|uniref:Ubiquitin-like-specific protease 1A n=1 Tax=Sesamum calycinum TaxID=2727403 RepID=A0AAW2QL59_9LAMI
MTRRTTYSGTLDENNDWNCGLSKADGGGDAEVEPCSFLREGRHTYVDMRNHMQLPFWLLARYYVDEVKDKSGEDINVSSWEKEFVTNLPDQKNGFDCGMFMIKYTDFYSRDIGLCFNQGNMPYFRQRTAKEILKLRAE